MFNVLDRCNCPFTMLSHVRNLLKPNIVFVPAVSASPLLRTTTAATARRTPRRCHTDERLGIRRQRLVRKRAQTERISHRAIARVPYICGPPLSRGRRLRQLRLRLTESLGYHYKKGNLLTPFFSSTKEKRNKKKDVPDDEKNDRNRVQKDREIDQGVSGEFQPAVQHVREDCNIGRCKSHLPGRIQLETSLQTRPRADLLGARNDEKARGMARKGKKVRTVDERSRSGVGGTGNIEGRD